MEPSNYTGQSLYLVFTFLKETLFLKAHVHFLTANSIVLTRQRSSHSARAPTAGL